jgi:hypothetical protein
MAPIVLREGTSAMISIRNVLLAAVFVSVAAMPAYSCDAQQTPQVIWMAIDASLAKANLTQKELARIGELRSKVFQMLAEQHKDGEKLTFYRERYNRAIAVTEEAMRIVGLELSSSPLRGCGGEYRLKDG